MQQHLFNMEKSTYLTGKIRRFSCPCNETMRQFILDGHNILHQDQELKGLLTSPRPERALQLLIARSQRIVSGKKSKLTIVFDGFPPGEVPVDATNVQVRFSRDRQADEIIKSLIERSRNPRNLVVVSHDTEIIRYARVHSCSVESPRQFLARLSAASPDAGDEKPETGDITVQEWLRIFRGET
jgi:hypothetical protein